MQLPKIIEQSGQRVLMTAQLAEAYGTDTKVISKNFIRNKERYEEGRHFYLVKGEDLKAIRQFDDLPKNINKLYLWTERGALLHAKSLNTDKAWEVYDYLIENYFRKPQPIAPVQPEPDPDIDMNAIYLAHYYEKVAKSAVALAEYATAKSNELSFIGIHPELKPLIEKEQG